MSMDDGSTVAIWLITLNGGGNGGGGGPITTQMTIKQTSTFFAD